MNESGRLICIRRDSAGSEDGVCFAVIAKEDHWKELEVRAPWTLFLGDCLTPWADSPSQPSTKRISAAAMSSQVAQILRHQHYKFASSYIVLDTDGKKPSERLSEPWPCSRGRSCFMHGQGRLPDTAVRTTRKSWSAMACSTSGWWWTTRRSGWANTELTLHIHSAFLFPCAAMCSSSPCPTSNRAQSLSPPSFSHDSKNLQF